MAGAGRLRLWLLYLGLIPVLFISLFPGPAAAQPGSLDPTFSGDGRLTTDFFGTREAAQDVIVLPDGKTIAAGSAVNPAGTAGDFALARYNADGTLDTSFGNGGRVTTDFFGSDDGILRIAVLSDGRIVAAGGAFTGGTPNLALARYTSRGALDTSFGTGGKVTMELGFARALAIQSDGRLVVAADGPAIARFTADGTLDATFGAGGLVEPDFTVADVSILSSGQIVAAGTDTVIIGPDPEDPEGSIGREVVAVARFNANGTPDTAFGEGGRVLTELDQVASRATAVVTQPDGKIVAVGNANNQFALVRYMPDGSVDTTFGTSGTVLTSLGGTNDQAFAAMRQADGRIVVAGWATLSESLNDFGLARYDANGQLDSTFGNGGVVTTDFLNNTADIAEAVAIGPDGKITAAGRTNLGDFPTDTFALARYQAALSPAAGIDSLLLDIEALLESGALNAGQSEALSANLRQVRARIEEGNNRAARAELSAFINQVNAMVSGGTLTRAQAQPLIAAATTISEQLS